MNCTSGCSAPGTHASWGECLRGKNIQLGDVRGVGTTKTWDADLSAYADARKAGIQPAGTERHHVDRAVRLSESTGNAWQS